MKKIINEIKKEFTINKSKFIGFIYHVESEEDVNKIVNEIKSKYKDATHVCFAYIINEIKRYNDDKEPIAGLPILNVLENNELNFVLSVVVRYFGGIKLGVGGLNRAYANACKICLEDNIKTIEKGFEIIINFKYEDSNKIDFLLKNSEIIDKKYNELIEYKFLITEKEYQIIENKLKNICQIIKIKNKLI